MYVFFVLLGAGLGGLRLFCPFLQIDSIAQVCMMGGIGGCVLLIWGVVGLGVVIDFWNLEYSFVSSKALLCLLG